MAIAWPNSSDYQDSLQNPTFCFSDTKLKAGQVSADRFGMPTLISGTFACVSRISSAGRTWAVRCFIREDSVRQERYRAIDSYLQAHPLPYFVGFEFLEQGILAHGHWYPVLKMEWVDGKPLDAYLKENKHDASKLRRFADQWLQMTGDLRSAGIAHGDLQHGNVLITPSDELKLIDYDGMFVPDLAGNPPNELGHPAYQHPNRSPADYSASMDTFSTWIIHGSVLALAEAPELWRMTGAGDERILFGRSDYIQPTNSEIFRALEEAEGAAAQFASFVQNQLLSNLSTAPVLSPQSAALLNRTLSTSESADGWLSHLTSASTGPSPFRLRIGDGPEADTALAERATWEAARARLGARPT